MDTEWQVSSGRSKKKSRQPEKCAPSTKSVYIINEDIIRKYKIANMKVTCILSEKFDKINKMFETSTQYLASKKKVNHNQRNHDHWETKKLSDINDVSKILSNFNMLSKSNFDIISEKLKELDIINYEDMEQVVYGIYKKCMNDTQFIDVYSRMLKFIMMECKWIVYDNISKPISFRKFFIDYLEFNYNQNITNIRVENDSSHKVKPQLKNERKNLIILFSNLFKVEIIGNQLFRYIFVNLENMYLDTTIDEYMIYWLIMFEYVQNEWSDKEFKYLDEKVKFIVDNISKLSVRVKILSEHIHSKQSDSITDSNVFDLRSKTNDEKEDVKVDEEDEEDVYDMNMFIMSIEEYGTMDAWYDSIVEIEYKGDLILEVIDALLVKSDDLKLTFKILKFIKNKTSKYKMHISKTLTKNLTLPTFKNNSSYVYNAQKILHK